MDPEKLSKYQFRAGSLPTQGGAMGEQGRTVVSAHRQGEDDPVAIIRITHGGSTNAQAQSQINRGNWEHGVNEDENGQRFFTGGSFDKPHSNDVDSIDWLGTTDRNPRLLQGLLATAGVEHARARGRGNLHADVNMTEGSGRLARRLSKSLDIKPHPKNSDMESHLDPLGDHQTKNNNINDYNQSRGFLQPISSEEVANNVGVIFGKGPRTKKPTGPQPEQLTFDEQLFGSSDPRDVISGERNVKPTSKRAMKGMGAGQCTYCGSYATTENSGTTGNDCYDCGSTTHGNWQNSYEQDI